jgi:mRNA-degrading endonuclease HigB of HigAB toxin-antitoxin module
MSSKQPSDNKRTGMIERFRSGPRVRRTIGKCQNAYSNVFDKYTQGAAVTKLNALDTILEMKKFYCPSEVKKSFLHAKKLAKETHEEMIGRRFRLMSETIRPVFKAQVNSILNRNNFEIDDESVSDEQE